MARTATVAPPAPPAPLPADLIEALRRLKLGTVRRLAPEILQTAKVQRWAPEEVLRTLYRAKSSDRVCELPFRGWGQAARRYSLITSPMSCCRRTGAWIATTASGSWSGGC